MFLIIAFSCLLSVFYGSFVGSYIIRFPKLIDTQSNVTIYSPRSRCEECGATLKYYMLIPLLSYLIQRGRCLFCKKSISKFYFLNELFHLSLMASILWSGVLPSNLESILLFLVIVSLYAQFLIDLRHLALSLFLVERFLFWDWSWTGILVYLLILPHRWWVLLPVMLLCTWSIRSIFS